MFCPKCKLDYRTGFTNCPDCDSDLVTSLLEPDKKEKKNDDVTFVPVLSTYNLGDITLLRSILDDQNIEYYMQGEQITYSTRTLLVREDQVETVKELLKNIDLKFNLLSTNQ